MTVSTIGPPAAPVLLIRCGANPSEWFFRHDPLGDSQKPPFREGRFSPAAALRSSSGTPKPVGNCWSVSAKWLSVARIDGSSALTAQAASDKAKANIP
jgi:hypothetical protein